MKADRRLFLTKDRDRVVESGDPAGAWLFYPEGRGIADNDAEKYGLEADEFGRVTYDGSPDLPELEASAPAPDDSDRNTGEAPEWTLETKPETYLKRNPDGPNAELARAVIAARDDGADAGG